MKELKKFVKSLKKYKISEKKCSDFEKNHIKNIIIKRRKDKKPIEPLALSIELGYPKELVENVNKEINDEKKKNRVKKVKKESKIKIELDKLKDKSKTIFDKEDKETIKDILSKIVLYGIPINFAVFVVTKGYFKFNYYNWIGWGITFWLIKKEIITMLRNIIHK